MEHLAWLFVLDMAIFLYSRAAVSEWINAIFERIAVQFIATDDAAVIHSY
jgi:hypothetical protein